MTWSIVARDASGQFGVAVASKFFAVGALCAHTRRGVGALSTQALMNPLYGAACLDLLAQGMTARQTVDHVVTADAGRGVCAIIAHRSDLIGGPAKRIVAAPLRRTFYPGHASCTRSPCGDSNLRICRCWRAG